MAYERLILASDDADAHWAFRARAPSATITFDGVEAVARDQRDRLIFRDANPFAAFAWMEKTVTDVPGARWVGYIAYEFARFVETLPARTRDDLALPLFRFSLCESQPTATSHLTKTSPDAIAKLCDRSASRPDFEQAVARAIDYIAAGDIFQVNLAQRFSFNVDPRVSVWDRLKTSRYAAQLAYADFTILSNSPELFFRVDRNTDGTRTLTSRPIKGTRPRTSGMEATLLASAKDAAELAMIVDLQRNDLGRVCEIGSVTVPVPREIEAHAGVYHTVATVRGTLRHDAGFADVVRALFPCGSITGCPKVRAMQIIDELELVARGPYCGAIGYIASDGTSAFNVAIRSMILKDDVAHVYVGGGIVADSTPAGEYDETLVKAQAMLDALNVPSAQRRSLSDR